MNRVIETTPYDLDFKMTIAGIPVPAVLALIAAICLLSYFYPATLIYILAAAPLAYAIRIHTFRTYPITVKADLGGPIPTTVVIKGLPASFKEDIEKAISENKQIVIGLPKKHKFNFLKTVLSEYIYTRAGFCEFTHSNNFSVSYRPLDRKALLLSYHSKQSLQDAISTILQRGWQIEGSQSTESNLISRVYTQTMVYNPNTASVD
ncbi:hypothetical protein [Rheinheimera hassiensis]|uniref:hypothetical protein n=1 Tax=Rheinheimera hassiensis TaxID=1193627 RepID=UPI001F056495|nr:hypothetical protein [Rheinheimera hassiensis]